MRTTGRRPLVSTASAIPIQPSQAQPSLAGASRFARILAKRDAPASEGWAWLGWIGMALAVLTKGLLPVVLIAALNAHVALFDRVKLAAIFEPGPIVAALALV